MTTPDPHALTDGERMDFYQRVKLDPQRVGHHAVVIYGADAGPDEDGYYRIGTALNIAKSGRGGDYYVWWHPEHDVFRYTHMPPAPPRPPEPWQIAARRRERARTPPVSPSDLHAIVTAAKAALAQKIPDKLLRCEVNGVSRYLVSRSEDRQLLGHVGTIKVVTVPPQLWLVLADYQSGRRVLREVRDHR